MSLTEVLLLVLAAAAAGAVNAVAGGGTLITFPALLAAGVTPIMANATSTLALLLGISGSFWGYRGQMAAVRPWLRRFVPVSVVGGTLGAVLLTHLGNDTFRRVVPFLILFATGLFVAQNAMKRLVTFEPVQTPRAIWIAILFQFFVSVYGGYFGAGIGILMLASLGFIGLHDIHEMNALKTILGALINLIAAGYFAATGLIDWPRMAVMTVGAFGGYWLGSHYSQKLPQQIVRHLITAIGVTLAAVMFWKQMSGGGSH